MKYLFVTEPDDTHAILTRLALEKMGHSVRFLFIADQPTRQINSIYIDNASYRWESKDESASVTENDYDVVWWRRVRKPYVPKELIHPEDYQFVARENVLFYECMSYNLAPTAWWINSKEAATRANAKLLQLSIAKKCGMAIPTTLCSNDAKEIQDFVRMHQDVGVIYKPLCANFWFEGNSVRISYTSQITATDVLDAELLQWTPGIFQKEIKKKYELRITCFGDYLVAAKLNSQRHLQGKVDWRSIPENEMQVEPYVLPDALQKQIRKFMFKMGLVFGSLDFIVTTDDQYIFLEVNEQGQFMWIEEYNPELKMFDIFVNFVLNRSKSFRWEPKNAKHIIGDYRTEMLQMMMRNMECHVDLNRAKPM